MRPIEYMERGRLERNKRHAREQTLLKRDLIRFGKRAAVASGLLGMLCVLAEFCFLFPEHALFAWAVHGPFQAAVAAQPV